ncbi:unnamed protein product [Pieris brassicae]|uniref:Uncharacterized protein n=1 Tax=Pieris brassicae TaxID=7116 RepID=A0A9P0TU82_PIEBR|nr:unnamed protein product [Pieris brassicae]
MEKYLVYLVIIHFIQIECQSIYERQNEANLKKNIASLKRDPRESDDYEDEGGFIHAPNTKTDHSFIWNVSSCPEKEVRAPWGPCITCKEYMEKLKKVGPGCT